MKALLFAICVAIAALTSGCVAIPPPAPLAQNGPWTFENSGCASDLLKLANEDPKAYASCKTLSESLYSKRKDKNIPDSNISYPVWKDKDYENSPCQSNLKMLDIPKLRKCSAMSAFLVR